KLADYTPSDDFSRERPRNQLRVVSACQLKQRPVAQCRARHDFARENIERLRQAEAASRFGIARIERLRLIAWEEHELGREIELGNVMEKCLREGDVS